MGANPGRGRLIDRSTPRTLFAELLARAVDETGVRPTPQAIAYLIGLLEARVATPEPDAAELHALCESLMAARSERGAGHIDRLRCLGDRALFSAGFFSARLGRTPFGLGACREVGRLAYADLSAQLACRLDEATWPRLFEELADCFREFVDVLAEVGDRAGVGEAPSLQCLYDRYLQTGSRRDRLQLLRRGEIVGDASLLRRKQ